MIGRNLWILMFFICGCAHSLPDRGVYVIYEHDLRAALQDLGFDKEADPGVAGISRDGTRMVCSECRLGWATSYYMLELRKAPRRLDWPADFGQVWLDEDCEVVAWIKEKESQVHLRGGRLVGTELPFRGFSQYGDYFFVQDLPGRSTKIYRTNQPDEPVIEYSKEAPGPVDYPPEQIFTYEGRLFVMNFMYGADGNYGRNCWVYGVKDGKLVKERETTIPGGFVAVDQQSGQILLYHSHDMPFPNIWFLYDEQTGKIKTLGTAENGTLRLLKADIVGDAIKRAKHG